MNNKFKKLWIAALRSGEFKQVQRTLRNNEGYCCYGVLCEIVRRETGEGEWHLITGSHYLFSFRGSKLSGYPPHKMMDFVELNNYAPVVYDEITTNLVNLNDNQVSFVNIANVIESQL